MKHFYTLYKDLAILTLYILGGVFTALYVYIQHSDIFASISILFAVTVGVYLVNNRDKEQLDKIFNVLKDVEMGKLSSRVLMIRRSSRYYTVARAVNNSLDQMESFIRETKASIKSINTKDTKNRNVYIDGLQGEFKYSLDLVGKSISSILESRAIIHKNFENISTIEENTISISDISSDTFISVQGAVVDLKSLLDNMAALHEKIENLSQDSKNVYDVISVIKEISDTIRLLAMNASVEAARAGEFGLSFGVVADEVKRLADDTNKTTSNIENQISHLLETIDGIKAESNAIFASGTKSRDYVDEIQVSLSKLNKSIEETTSMVNLISKATKDIN
jgi:methyl-accepting chemotaxis protein